MNIYAHRQYAAKFYSYDLLNSNLIKSENRERVEEVILEVLQETSFYPCRKPTEGLDYAKGGDTKYSITTIDTFGSSKGEEVSLIDRVGELDDVLMSNTNAQREWDEIVENYLDGENAEYWGDLGNQELEDIINEAEALIKKYKIDYAKGGKVSVAY